MAFADQVAADLAVFVNPTEFGEVRSIDGVDTPCVLDDDLRLPGTSEGVYLSESLLHVRKEDLEAVPAITQRMMVGDRQGNVVHVDEAMGMVSIRLRWFES